MIGWNHLVEIKRIEKLALIIFPPTHHARLPLMPIHQRNHGSRVVSTGVLQHYLPESRHWTDIPGGPLLPETDSGSDFMVVMARPLRRHECFEGPTVAARQCSAFSRNGNGPI